MQQKTQEGRHIYYAYCINVTVMIIHRISKSLHTTCNSFIIPQF